MSDDSQRPDEDEIAPGDDFDGLPDDNGPAAVREELRRKLKTEGARVAVDTMLAVCKDPKAQASARATCAVGLLRAAGYLSKKAEEEDEAEGKPLHEMTNAELSREWARAKQRRLRARSPRGDDGGSGNVFD